MQALLGLSPQPLPPVENVGRARTPVPVEVREQRHSFYRELNQRLQTLLPEFPIWNDET